jgi:hypothetical protein
MEVRLAIDVCVEMDVAELLVGSDSLGQSLADGDRQRMIATDADGHRSGIEDVGHALFDVVARALGIGWNDRNVAGVDEPEFVEKVDVEVAEVRQVLVGNEPHHLRGEARSGTVDSRLVERHPEEDSLGIVLENCLRLARDFG